MNIEKAKSSLSDLLSKAGFTIDALEVATKADDEYSINISSADATGLIGHNGEVLFSLQHLAKNIFRNQGIVEDKDHVKIDVDAYRSRQELNVTEMADKRAQHVIETGRSASLPPMSS